MSCMRRRIGGRTRVRRRRGQRSIKKTTPRDIQHFLMSLGQRRRRCLNNCARGTLAHVILEMRLWSVARLSNHRPSFLLVLFFLEETGPCTVAMVLKASFLAARRRLAFLGWSVFDFSVLGVERLHRRGHWQGRRCLDRNRWWGCRLFDPCCPEVSSRPNRKRECNLNSCCAVPRAYIVMEEWETRDETQMTLMTFFKVNHVEAYVSLLWETQQNRERTSTDYRGELSERNRTHLPQRHTYLFSEKNQKCV